MSAGWQIRAALAAAVDVLGAPDAGAQEKRWRTALKRARHERRERERAIDAG